ncbi:MAG: protein phosphatase CheZ [Gammaproteobacteria bacterium]|nr:MAG: protein phosphatase CheZ [Gammaproteobacteria bacterium]
MECDDAQRIQALLEELSRVRESELFQQIGRLTRELHEALRNVELEERLADLAEEEMPDARNRLNYVIEKTQEAADKTLTAVETALPLTEGLSRGATDLASEWQRFRRRELNLDQFRELSGQMDRFLDQVRRDSTAIGAQLNAILMAQDFQDLTGQVIRRVIEVVTDAEQRLVDLVRVTGMQMEVKKKGEAADTNPEGPQIAPDETGTRVSGQDEVDDLLSSLGF